MCQQGHLLTVVALPDSEHRQTDEAMQALSIKEPSR
jgi:hypothetical protein